MFGRPAAAQGKDYRLGPEDVLQINVARHPEWSTEQAVVPQDGRIVLPVVGTLEVNGKTLQQVEGEIRERLSKRLVNPEVGVSLRTARKQRVYVGGPGVKMGGVFDWKPGWRVTEALAEAQGILGKPERTIATLFRPGQEPLKLDLERLYIKRDPTANPALQPGDILDVQQEPTVRVYVGGAVKKPSIVELVNGGGVLEAISLAEGLLPTAAATQATVQKASTGEIIPLNLDDAINKGKPLPVLKLEPGDVVTVPENKNRVIVFGRVKMPNAYPIPDGKTLTVTEAVSMAQGYEKDAEKTHIGVIRGEPGKRKILLVDVREVLEINKAPQRLADAEKDRTGEKRSGKKRSKKDEPLPEGVERASADLVVQDGDIVVVPRSNKTDWGGLLGGVQAASVSLLYLFGLGI